MNEKLQELQEMRINGKNPYLISNLLQDKELLKSIKSILDIGDIMDEDTYDAADMSMKKVDIIFQLQTLNMIFYMKY